MNNAEVIRSYLVSLGFAVNQPELRKFDDALKSVDGLIGKSTSSIAKNMLGWQTAIVSAFSAVSAGVLGLIDKTAQAELGYQNFGVQMLMGAEQAKKLKIALDAVGMSLDEAAWNPEGMREIRDFLLLQEKLQSTLGPDYRHQVGEMFKLLEQFRMLRIEWLYLQQAVAAGLLRGIGGENLIKRLQAINDWIVQNGPKIVDWISRNIAPVFKDWEHIVKDLVGMFEQMGVVFTNFIGLLSGDNSIEGAQFDFEKLGKAVQHVVHWFSEFVDWITLAERMLLHFASAAELAIYGVGALASHHTETALKLFQDARKEFQAGFGDITFGNAGIAGGAAAGAILGSELGSIVPGAGTLAGGLLGAGVGATAGMAGMTIATDRWASDDQKNAGEHGFTFPQGQAKPAIMDYDLAEKMRGLAIKVSKNTGVPADWIWSQWAHESGNFDTSKGAARFNNFAGITQPLPGNPYQHFASPEDFANTYEEWLKRPRFKNALYAQNIDEFASGLKLGGWFTDSLDNYLKDMKRLDAYFFERPQSSGDTHMHIDVGGIHITQPGATKEQIQDAVSKGVQDAMSRKTQVDLVNMRGVYGY